MQPRRIRTNKLTMTTRPWMFVCLVTVWIALSGHVCNGGTELEMRQLLDSLLNSTQYSSRVRPIQDTGSVLTVTVSMYLVAVNDIDEVEQKITTTAYLDIHWNDSFMQWDPSLHGDIAKITVPQDRIWKPDLALANAYDTIDGLGDSFIYITITDAGEIKWYPYEVFQSTCNLDMTYFPFDTQKCDIQLVTWSSTRDMVNIVVGSDGFNAANYETNANWDLIGTSTADSSTSTTAGLSFSVRLRRKPAYYLLNFILPIVLLSILNVFVFLLPCESGEKTSYAIILFLSFAIFLLIVTEIMPDGMTHVPIMSTYLLFECVMSTIIVFLTICQLRLHYQGEETPVPSFMKTFTHSVFAMKKKVSCNCLPKRKQEEPLPEHLNTIFDDDAQEEVKAPVVKRRTRTWKKKPPKKLKRRRRPDDTEVKEPRRVMRVFQPVLKKRSKLRKRKTTDTSGPISTIDITEYGTKHQGIEMTDGGKGLLTQEKGNDGNIMSLNTRKHQDGIENAIRGSHGYRQHNVDSNVAPKRQTSRIKDFFTSKKKVVPSVMNTSDDDDMAITQVAQNNLQNHSSAVIKGAKGLRSHALPKPRLYTMVGRTSFSGFKTARVGSAAAKSLADGVSGNVSYTGSKTAQIGSTTGSSQGAGFTDPDSTKGPTGEAVSPSGIKVTKAESTMSLSLKGSRNTTQSSIGSKASVARSTALSLYSRLTSGGSNHAWSTSTTSENGIINKQTPSMSTDARSYKVSGVQRRNVTGTGAGKPSLKHKADSDDIEEEIVEVMEMCNSSIAGSVTDIQQAVRVRLSKQKEIFDEDDDDFDVEYSHEEVVWSDVTTASDVVFFIIFCTLNVLATIIVFTVTAVGGMN